MWQKIKCWLEDVYYLIMLILVIIDIVLFFDYAVLGVLK